MFNFLKSAKGKPAKAKPKTPEAAKPKAQETAKPKAQEAATQAETAQKAAPKGLPSRQASPPLPVPPPGGGAATSMAEGADTVGLPDMPALAMTAERAKLIEKALSVHRTKQNVFADLDPKDRQKLMVMAMLTLLPRGKRNG